MIVRPGQRYTFRGHEVRAPAFGFADHADAVVMRRHEDVRKAEVVDEAPGVGRLLEIGPAKLPPVFRHDADEHRRLQQLFRRERDVTLGTS